MGIMTMRAVPKTIAGRQRALALKGNNRFARFANLTGTEVLGKIQDAQLSLAVKAQGMLDMSRLQPAYALAGILENQVVETPNNMYMSADQAAGTGTAKGAKNRTKDQKIADFEKFMYALEQKQRSSNSFVSGITKATLGSAGIAIVPAIGTIIEGFGYYFQLGMCLIGTGFVLSGMMKIFESLCRGHSSKSSMMELAARYQDKKIPSAFKDFDPHAAAKLELMVQEARAKLD